jgi:hypothetical protein
MDDLTVKRLCLNFFMIVYEQLSGCEQPLGRVQPLPSALQPSGLEDLGLGRRSLDRKRLPRQQDLHRLQEHRPLEEHFNSAALAIRVDS